MESNINNVKKNNVRIGDAVNTSVLLVKKAVMNYLNGNLILRYITNQCNDQERSEFEAWMNQSRSNEQTYLYFRNVMGAVSAS